MSEQQTFRRACPTKWRKTADVKKLRHCQNMYTPRNSDDDGDDDDDVCQVLRFEDNRLTVLGDGVFSSYANLQEIYLARNRLELIEATAFRGLYSLQILDLEANQLSSVPATSLLAVASSLRLLSIKNNPIRRLDADSLSRLTRLEEARSLSVLVGIDAADNSGGGARHLTCQLRKCFAFRGGGRPLAEPRRAFATEPHWETSLLQTP